MTPDWTARNLRMIHQWIVVYDHEFGWCSLMGFYAPVDQDRLTLMYRYLIERRQRGREVAVYEMPVEPEYWQKQYDLYSEYPAMAWTRSPQ